MDRKTLISILKKMNKKDLEILNVYFGNSIRNYHGDYLTKTNLIKQLGGAISVPDQTVCTYKGVELKEMLFVRELGNAIDRSNTTCTFLHHNCKDNISVKDWVNQCHITRQMVSQERISKLDNDGWSRSKKNIYRFLYHIIYKKKYEDIIHIPKEKIFLNQEQIEYIHHTDIPQIIVSHGKFMRDLHKTINSEFSTSHFDIQSKYIFFGIPKTINSFLVDLYTSGVSPHIIYDIRTKFITSLIQIYSEKHEMIDSILTEDKYNLYFKELISKLEQHNLLDKFIQKTKKMTKKPISESMIGNGAILQITIGGKKIYLVRHMFSWGNYLQETSTGLKTYTNILQYKMNFIHPLIEMRRNVKPAVEVPSSVHFMSGKTKEVLRDPILHDSVRSWGIDIWYDLLVTQKNQLNEDLSDFTTIIDDIIKNKEIIGHSVLYRTKQTAQIIINKMIEMIRRTGNQVFLKN